MLRWQSQIAIRKPQRGDLGQTVGTFIEEQWINVGDANFFTDGIDCVARGTPRKNSNVAIVLADEHVIALAAR